MSKDNGGAEFPGDGYWEQSGMTLRDYFAAKAMQAIIQNNELLNMVAEDGSELGINPQKSVARYAVTYADALLDELDKK